MIIDVETGLGQEEIDSENVGEAAMPSPTVQGGKIVTGGPPAGAAVDVGRCGILLRGSDPGLPGDGLPVHRRGPQGPETAGRVEAGSLDGFSGNRRRCAVRVSIPARGLRCGLPVPGAAL